MAPPDYRTPSELELVFLRAVTRGYPELEKQIESCEVADYDPAGRCYVHSTGGPPSAIVNPADGPTLDAREPHKLHVDILLWTNEAGMLKAVEIVDYGTLPPSLGRPYQLFVDAAKRGCLEYAVQGH